jgi:putative aminopeptidase FrvX
MTDELLHLLMDLLSLPGISGAEAPVAARLRKSWEPLVDELNVDRLGNLIAIRKGVGPPPRPKVLLTAHMDSVGLVVRGMIDGFILVDQVGLLDHRILPGQMVKVYGAHPLPGMIVAPPSRCLPEDIADHPVPIEYLLVDLGLPPSEVQRAVKVGDIVSFDNPPLMLTEDVISGHSLDNRASLAALTLCLESLAGRDVGWDLFVAATVQEETTYHGAHVAAQVVEPDVAIVVDVTYGRAYSERGSETFALGGGPTNAWSPEVHPGVYAEIEAAAGRAGVPLAREILPTETGTEASGIQLAGSGIPLGLLSIPLRYMHSPTEVVDLADIRMTGLVLAELISGLDDKSFSRFVRE